jgi:hypothetical protein
MKRVLDVGSEDPHVRADRRQRNWRGRSAVVAAARKNFAPIENQQPEIEAMISHGESIAVLLREGGVFNSTGHLQHTRRSVVHIREWQDQEG